LLFIFPFVFSVSRHAGIIQKGMLGDNELQCAFFMNLKDDTRQSVYYNCSRICWKITINKSTHTYI